ncbi:MAG: molybdopterin-dependent oxidoreductase [Coriobacteriales bacterium]|jgi:hypothetical protein
MEARSSHARGHAVVRYAAAAVCVAGLVAALGGVSAAGQSSVARAAESSSSTSAQAASASSDGTTVVEQLFQADQSKFDRTASNDNTFASTTKYAADQPEPAQSADSAGMDAQSTPYTSEQYIEDNTPTVTVLDDGTQIQRIPNDIGYDAYKLNDFMPSYNKTYLNGENRGCGACHDDLAELVSNMTDFDHQDITRCAPVEYTVQMCIDCHTWQPGYITQQYTFGDLIHNIHQTKYADQFQSMGGNCWSCHITQDTNTQDTLSTNDELTMPLFDEVKHDIFGGITQVADQSDVDAQVVWDQKKSSWDATWDYNWRGPGYYWDHDRYHYQEEGTPLSKDLFNNWTITVNGCVGQEVTFNLTDLINEGHTVDVTKAMICTMNPMGGSFFGNYDIKAIPFSYLLQQAGGYTDDAASLQVTAADGSHEDLTRDVFSKHIDDIYIVYEINGHLLNWEDGYPVWCWCSFMSAGNSWKSVSDFTFSDTSDPWLPNQNGWHEQSDEWTQEGNERNETQSFYNKPQVGFLNVKEGTVIETGKPYTIEGWSHGYDWTVKGIQVSMDGGATWTEYDFDDVDPTLITNWYYTFTPQEDTSYVVRVRTICTNGRVSDEPVELMLVSHSADQIAADAQAAGKDVPTAPSYDISDDAVAESGEVTDKSSSELNEEAIAAHPEWSEEEAGVNTFEINPDDPYTYETISGGSASADATAAAASSAKEGE